MSGSKLILLSAADAKALERRAEDTASFLQTDPGMLPDVAYTLAVGRKRFSNRAAIVLPDGTAPGDVVRRMERENTERTQVGAASPPQVAFMFPGQGSQFIGMGRGLFEGCPTFRERFKHCDQILTSHVGVSLEELLFRSDNIEEASEVLRQTRIAQPALFVVEYCSAQLFLEHGIQPDALIGHSIGEFVAACLGGVFELDAALQLVAERGRLMQSQPPGSMVAVRCSPDALSALLNDDVTLAAHNAPELCVVSGADEPVRRFLTAADGLGLELKELHTSHAFHSPMMDPILEPFRRAVERAQAKPPTMRIISTLTGQVMTAEEATSSDYWAHQLRQAVQFSKGVRTLFDGEDRVFIEVGPGTALTTSAAKQVDLTRPRALLESLGGPKDPRPALDAHLRCLGRLWIHGAELNFNALFEGSQRRLLRLPTYPFTRQLHWVKPPLVSEEGSVPDTLFLGVEEGEGQDAESLDVERRLVALLGSRLGRVLTSADFEHSFLELGFDSLALSQLRVRLQEQFGVDVSVRQLFEGQDTPQLLVELVRTMTTTPGPTEHTLSSLEGRPTQENQGPRRAVTTDPQRELWVACAAGGEEATLCYNECRRLDFRGELDFSLLEAALQRLLQRHEALRQVFDADGAEFTVLPYQGFALRLTDLRALDSTERNARLARFCQDEVATPFDLERGPLFRAHLIRSEEEHSVLLLCAHHIAADGSSIFLLLRELSEVYSSLKEQRPLDLPSPDSYLAYAERQRNRLQSVLGQTDQRFWLEHLASHADDLDLPTDRPRPTLRSFRAERQDFYLDPTTTAALRSLGLQAKTTLQTVLMAVVQLVLQRLTRQTDLVIGMPASGQAAVGARALVGHCVHVLPIRQHVESTKRFIDHLSEVRHTLLNCLEHQEITLSSYVGKLGRPRDPSRMPLVPFGFGMGRTPSTLSFSGLETQIATVPRLYETFEIYLFATEDGERVNLAWSYNTDLFDAEAIQLWQRCLKTAITSVTGSSGQAPIGHVEILSAEDRTAILQLAQGSQTSQGEFVSAHERFLQTAARFPDETAVIAVDQDFTYAQLNRQANQWGQWLSRRGLSPGSLVAVCLERASALVWSLLGVWRAGLAYVPLDPNYPKARVQMILEDSRAGVLLTSRALVENIVDEEIPSQVQIVLIEEILDELTREPNAVPQVERDPSHPAYVIFTSGSTGRPKGVQISQRAFENFLVSMAKTPGFSSSDRILALTTVSFDIAGLELFLPLTQGGALVLVSAEQAMDPAALTALIKQHRVNVLQATPATWQMLLEGGWKGDSSLKVLCGGEAFPQNLAERLLSCCGEVWNVYGPTETTVWSSVKKVTQATDLAVGRPIDNTTMYVLDENRELVPFGSAGELWIGGRGVATGYWGRADLTEERFKSNPFVEGDVIYRTGDLSRIKRNGEFECLGRVDFQVKIRGFRIELGEIETAILKHPAVASAVVVAREDKPGDKILVAYAVPKAGQSIVTAELRQQIAGLLPAYMVPSAFCVLDALPMTPNNKVDRKALPPPVQVARLVQGPRNRIEKQVAEIWHEALGLSNLSIDDDFFALGGHSLLAIRIASRLSQQFETQIAISDFFSHPTLQGLSTLLSERVGTRGQFEPLRPRGSAAARLSSNQERIAVIQQLYPENSPYNVSLGLRLRGQVESHLLKQAVQAVLSRHVSLRSSIVASEHGFEPRIFEDVTVPFEEHDLFGLSESAREESLRSLLARVSTAPFTLNVAPLLRVAFVRLSPEEHIFLSVFHHAIFDGWSMGIYQKEVLSAYDALRRRLPVPLDVPDVDFYDFVHSDQNVDAEEATLRLREVVEALGSDLPELQLPSDRPRPVTFDYQGAIINWKLPEDLMNSVKDLASRQRTSVYVVLLSAYQALLHGFSGQDVVVVGLPVAGRNHPDTHSMIGMFVNTLAVKSDISEGPTFEQLVQRSSKAIAFGLARERVPFDQLVDALNIKRDTSRTAVFQALFSYEQFGTRTANLEGLAIEPLPVTASNARTDVSLFLHETEGSILGTFEYSTQLFDRATIERFADAYSELVRGAVAQPQLPLKKLSLLTDAEKETLRTWNATSKTYPMDRTAAWLVEQQVDKSPERTAVRFGERSITYGALEARSNQWARALRRRGIGRGQLVGLCLERSIEMVVALLAVLKSGAGYVPLDPGFPAERLALMVEDSGLMLVVSESNLRTSHGCDESRTLEVDTAQAELEQESSSRLPLDDLSARANDTAYVLYTSGSTGRPKGVQVHHRAAVNFLMSMLREPGLNESDRLLAVTTLSFDISVLELLLPLIAGAQVVLASRDEARDGLALCRLLDDGDVTVMQATPATWRLLLECGWSGRPGFKVLCGGEALAADLAQSLLERAGELWNMYGPTETTVWSSVWRVRAPEQGIRIGRPIANTSFWILNTEMLVCPIGVVGEMYIGGDGVAQGYLNRQDLSRERFVPDPFSNGAGARLYRTGDLGRWRADGDLECLGRNDFQVKIRGFRIELGDIESALLKQEEVASAVVVARDDQGEEKMLAAYLVSKLGQSIDIDRLRSALSAQLPAYMVPSAFCVMDALPMTPNNKVDRKALPAPTKSKQDEGQISRPRTPVEETLYNIFCEFLDAKAPGIDGNFFELGGTSLQSIRVVDRINKHGLHATPTMLFQNPTVRKLAEAMATRSVASETETSLGSILALRAYGERPPLFLLHSLPGDLLGYGHLVHHLGEDQPCYGFHGLGKPEPNLRTLRDLAARYAANLQDFYPNGVVHLAGWCFGGTLALEVAHELRASGRQVGMVGLMEAWPSRSKLRGRVRSVAALLQGKVERMPSRKALARRFIMSETTPEEEGGEFFLEISTGPFAHRAEIYARNRAASRAHRSRPYDGPIALIRSSLAPEWALREHDYGWSEFAMNLRVEKIPAEHKQVLSPPHVMPVAMLLRKFMDEFG